MRRNVFLPLAGLLFAATTLPAQSLIEQAEKGLSGPARPAAAAPAPTYGYLGFTPDEDYKGNDGVRVKAVKAAGPAEAAGLKKDDLIKTVDGKPVFTVDEMDTMQTATTPGQIWRLTLMRAGKLQSVSVKLGTRPVVTASDTDPGEAPHVTPVPSASPPALAPPAAAPPPALSPPAVTPALTPPATAPPATPAPGAFDPLTPAAPAAEPPAAAPGANPIRSQPAIPPAAVSPPVEVPAPGSADSLPTPPPAAFGGGGGASLGITVVPLSPEAIAAYGVGTRRGALITAIRPGSPADTAGLPVGAVVITIDGKRIDTADDLVSFVRGARPGQEVELGYMQGDRAARKTVKLAPAATVFVPPTPGPAAPAFGPDRPFLNKVERIVDGLSNNSPLRGTSTVYNPLEMATLKSDVARLTEEVKQLKARLEVLEGRGGGAAPAAPAPALGGAFGAPAPNP